MTFELREILQSKRALRQRLAALPLGDKFRMLDVLRERSLALGANRRSVAGHSDDLNPRVPPDGRGSDSPRPTGGGNSAGHEGTGERLK